MPGNTARHAEYAQTLPAGPLPSGKPVASASARASAALLPPPSFGDGRDDLTNNVSGFGNGGPIATAGDLSVGVDESTWVLTSYLVSNAIILSMGGWFSMLFGRKRFFMICVAQPFQVAVGFQPEPGSSTLSATGAAV